LYLTHHSFKDPENKPAKEHFELLKEEWTQAVDKLAANLDSCADAGKLVRALELQMIEDQKDVKSHVSTNDVARVLPSAGNMARRAHRVLMVAKREAKNSEGNKILNRTK
jgi:vinculin